MGTPNGQPDFNQFFAQMMAGMQQGQGGTGTGTGGAAGQANPMAMWQQMMAGMGGPQGETRPEILYRDQLRQLNDMGFTNAQQNVSALVATGGNLEAAIDRLVQGL